MKVYGVSISREKLYKRDFTPEKTWEISEEIEDNSNKINLEIVAEILSIMYIENNNINN